MSIGTEYSVPIDSYARTDAFALWRDHTTEMTA